MIIFNDSVSKFTSALFKVFAEACFLVSALAKKCQEFLGILKNASPKIKYIFVLKRKAMFQLFQIFSNFIL